MYTLRYDPGPAYKQTCTFPSLLTRGRTEVDKLTRCAHSLHSEEALEVRAHRCSTLLYEKISNFRIF